MKRFFFNLTSVIHSPIVWAFALFAVCFSLCGLHPADQTVFDPIRLSYKHPEWSGLISASLLTAWRMLSAIILSVPLAFGVARVLRRRDTIGRVVSILVDFARTIPIIALLALFSGFGCELSLISATAATLAIYMGRNAARSTHAVPTELIELCRALDLTKWQTFWRCRAPVAMPVFITALVGAMPLCWTTLCGGEYLISCSNDGQRLIGIGAFVNAAFTSKMFGLGSVSLLITGVIVIAFDAMLLRPCVFWARRFTQQDARAPREPVTIDAVYHFLQRRKGFEWIGHRVHRVALFIANLRFGRHNMAALNGRATRVVLWERVLPLALIIVSGLICLFLRDESASWRGIGLTLTTIFITITILTTCCVMIALVWLPLAVLINLNRWACEPFLTCFRVISLFPLVIVLPTISAIIHEFGMHGFWALLPAVLIAGQWGFGMECLDIMRRFPADLLEVARNLDVRGLLWWQKVLLPGIEVQIRHAAARTLIFCWNLLIIAEFIESARDQNVVSSYGASLAMTLLRGQDLMTLLLAGLVTSVVWMCVTLLEGDTPDDARLQ